MTNKEVLDEAARIIHPLIAAHRGCVSGAKAPALFAIGSYVAFAAILKGYHDRLIADGVEPETLKDLQSIAAVIDIGIHNVPGPGSVNA